MKLRKALSHYYKNEIAMVPEIETPAFPKNTAPARQPFMPSFALYSALALVCLLGMGTGQCPNALSDRIQKHIQPEKIQLALVSIEQEIQKIGGSL